MCGIAGIVNIDGQPVSQRTLKAMCDIIAYRGPDDEGIYTDCNLGLGHRRLAIIDLSSLGHEPMANEDSSVILTYNGEIYNFQQLRLELESYGHLFHSKTDAEVIIHAYEQWGLDCLHKFNGMFAFALWDAKQKRLFLARDRYGIKPLYYYIDEKVFVFASEIKAILTHSQIKKRLCYEAMGEYFTFQNIYSDKTMFQGIKIIPAGHYAILSVDNASFHTSQYWDFTFHQTTESQAMSFSDASIRVRELFHQAVTRQLMSDVPLGSYLSGGMDSGSIVAIASRSIPRLMTFTGGFDLTSATGLEANFDERQVAELMAAEFLTEHYEMVMHSGDMARVLPNLTWHLEDLRLGMSYQNWYIARLASRFVKVVLSGGGGDELFGGYPWRYNSLLFCPPHDFKHNLYRQWQRLLPDENKQLFYSDETLKKLKNFSAFEVFLSVVGPFKEGSTIDPEFTLNRVLYFEAKTFLHGLLVVEDKISSSHSLETRLPFLDNDLVDFILTLPARYKLDIKHLKEQYSSQDASKPILSSDGKYILRHAMNGLIPDEVLNRKKQGFSPPDGSWYRGVTMNYLQEILLSPRTLSRGYFKPAYIKKIVNEHIEGKINHRLMIWSLISFEWWNRIFLDGVTFPHD